MTGLAPGRTTPGQALLRLVLLLAPPAALLLSEAAGVGPAAWLVVLVTLVAATWALFPESAAGSAALFLVVAWWGLGLRDGLHPAALGAAALVLGAHVAAVVAAYGPPTLAVDPALVRRWALRGGLVLLSSPAVFLLVRAVRDGEPPPGLWTAGMVAVLGAVVVANVLHERRTTP